MNQHYIFVTFSDFAIFPLISLFQINIEMLGEVTNK